MGNSLYYIEIALNYGLFGSLWDSSIFYWGQNRNMVTKGHWHKIRWQTNNKQENRKEQVRKRPYVNM